MLCNKCNHKLPDDSEFCQYCGNKIEKVDVEPDAVINETNKKDISTTTEKTIYYPKLSLSYPDEPQKKHGNYNVYGKDIAYIPPDNEGDKKKINPATEIILNRENSDKKEIQVQKIVKKRYCKMCGSVIDNKTKVCTGCGKKYFRWSRLIKVLTVIGLVLVIAITSTLYILQYVNALELKDEISNLENKISDLEDENYSLEIQVSKKDSTINRLNDKIDDLEDENMENWSKLYFFDNHAEVVGDDGTKVYHKWGCSMLDTSNGFWIFNTEAAQGEGYKKCSNCH